MRYCPLCKSNLELVTIENNAKLKKVNNFVFVKAEKYGDLYEWAKHTLWFGRRIARYKTTVIDHY